MARGAYPQIDATVVNLRKVPRRPDRRSLARKDEAMTLAEMATYAYDQIDRARTELNAIAE